MVDLFNIILFTKKACVVMYLTFTSLYLKIYQETITGERNAMNEYI